MPDPLPTPSVTAWEPLTPRGVAAFAHATSNRLFLVQFVVAVMVAGVVVWFLNDAWFPTVRAAILRLPEKGGEIRAATLQWPGESPQLLAEGTFLAFSVDLSHSGEVRSPAHVQVEFARQDLRVRSLLGYVELDYPTNVVAFNREALLPWWGAWRPQFLGLAALATLGGLMATWFGLAILYAVPIWLLVFYVNRDLRPVQCWRLAGAALMPGAMLMAVGILLYDFGVIDLVGLGFVTAGHFVLGWIYIFICPLFLPRLPQAGVTKNPFTAPKRG